MRLCGSVEEHKGVWGGEVYMLVQDLQRWCIESNLTLSVAESASGGRLAAEITSEPGASSYFAGGVVAYSLDQKVRLLQIDAQHAAQVNCVSEQVAMEMAAGVRQLCQTSIGVSITGYVDGENPYCWIGFAIGDKVWAERCEATLAPWLSKHDLRAANQEHYAFSALEGLLDSLQRLP